MQINNQILMADKDDNQRFADIINEYWKEKGFNVKARLVRYVISDGIRNSIKHSIASDLVDGLPKKRLCK